MSPTSFAIQLKEPSPSDFNIFPSDPLPDTFNAAAPTELSTSSSAPTESFAILLIVTLLSKILSVITLPAPIETTPAFVIVASPLKAAAVIPVPSPISI